MNSFETEYSNLQVEEEEANTNKLALDTANLVDYIKREMGVDLLQDKEVTYVKRYVDENLLDFVFTWKNNMYMATYLQGIKEFYISNLIILKKIIFCYMPLNAPRIASKGFICCS